MVIPKNNFSALSGVGFVVEENGRVVSIAHWAKEQRAVLAKLEQLPETQKTHSFSVRMLRVYVPALA
jgi:hypothetical protein